MAGAKQPVETAQARLALLCSCSAFISSTSDLKIRIERPRLRAASGRRLNPKSRRKATTMMMMCHGLSAPIGGRCPFG